MGQGTSKKKKSKVNTTEEVDIPSESSTSAIGRRSHTLSIKRNTKSVDSKDNQGLTSTLRLKKLNLSFIKKKNVKTHTVTHESDTNCKNNDLTQKVTDGSQPGAYGSYKHDNNLASEQVNFNDTLSLESTTKVCHKAVRNSWSGSRNAIAKKWTSTINNDLSLPSTSKNYKKTAGTGGDVGFRYETKITAFIALKLFNNTDEFYLASNLQSGGKFDDLVFTMKQKGKHTTWFIQLKHKERKNIISTSSLATKSKSDFSLPTYFKSWKKLLEQQYAGLNEDPIFFKNFNSIKFAIFTNAELSNDLLIRKFPSVDIGLLSTHGEYEKNIQFQEQHDQDLFINIFKDSIFQIFIKNFYLCTGQKNEENINIQIEDEYRKAARMNNLTSIDVKGGTAQFFEYLHDWKKRAEYLTKQNVSKFLNKMYAGTIIDKPINNNIKSGIRYIDPFLQDFSLKLRNNSLVILSYKAEIPLMCLAALKQLNLTDEPNKLISSSILNSAHIQNFVLDLWKNEMALYIECFDDVLQIVDFIIKLSNSNSKNLVVLIISEFNQSLPLIKNKLPRGEILNFDCNFQNIQLETKILISEKKIIFQGYEEDFLAISGGSNKMNNVFDLHTMTQLLSNSELSIGTKPLEKIDFYIPRVLMRRTTVKPAVFQTDNCIFAISSTSLQSVKDCFHLPSIETVESILKNKKDVKIIVLENEYQNNYSKLLKQSIKPVHWLQLFKSKLYWKCSSADINVIQDYLTYNFDYFATDDILRINDRIVILSAEPGMGKSTLLLHMAAETKRCRPKTWIVVVTLNDFTDHFQNCNFLTNVKSSTLQLLSAAAGIDQNASKLTKRFFEFCYNNGKMIVLLDGFDEICPFYLNQGLELIKTLKNSTITRIWITTRPIITKVLENATNTLAYTIKPFGPKDQLNFLKKYWSSRMENISETQLNNYINNLLGLFGNDVKEFTGIPLQTRMIAEIFEKDLKNGIFNLPEQIDFIDLFSEFINKKLEILWNEKSKLSMSNAVARLDQKCLDNNRIEILKKLALITLLPRNILLNLEPPITEQDIDEIKIFVNDGNEKTGLVVSFYSKIPTFIHRNFAEYLTAKFFSEKVGSNFEFLSSELFHSSDFKVVKHLFDRMLCKGIALHEAILNQDMTAFDNIQNINCLDRGKRSGLHLAASLPGSEYFIKNLILKGCSTVERDSVLKWIPSQYALRTKCLTNIATFMDTNCVFESALFTNSSVPITWETLLQCFIGDYKDLYIYLEKNDIEKVTGLNELIEKPWFQNEKLKNVTCLHLAAFYNSKYILEYIFSVNSKIHLINSFDSSGHTPLHYAIIQENIESVEILIENNASLLLPTFKNRTPIGLSLDVKNNTIFSFLLSTAEKNKINGEELFGNAVQNLISDKFPAMVRKFKQVLDVYQDLPKWVTNNGSSIFYFGCTKGNIEVIKILLSKGVDPKEPCKFGFPVETAIYNGHIKIVELLLEWYKNLKSVNLTKSVFAAAKRGFFKVLTLLIERGVDLKLKDWNNNTLFHAISCGIFEKSYELVDILKRLHQHGVDYNNVNNDNISGLHALIKAGMIANSDIFSSDMRSESINLIEIENPVKNSRKKSRRRNRGKKNPNQNNINAQSNDQNQNIVPLPLLSQTSNYDNWLAEMLCSNDKSNN